MDVARSRTAAPSRKILGALAIVVLCLGAAAVWGLIPHSPGEVAVERSSLVLDTVRRGTFERTVSAPGTLASQNIRVVDAVEPGIVERVFVKPGTFVNAGDGIALLSNADLQASVVGARSALAVARAQLASARQQAKASALAQQSSLSGAQAQMQEDSTSFVSLEGLHKNGLVADSTYRISHIKQEQSQRQVAISRSQIAVDAADQDAKVAAAQAQVDAAAAELSAKEQQVGALTLRAGASGVVQVVDVNPGVRVDAGTELAKIADQSSLSALLQVPEGEVHDVLPGMRAWIDMGNGPVGGRVVRIAPAAINGAVAVEVAFIRGTPAGARPDLTVDGKIVLQSVKNALTISRPSGAADNASIKLYRVERSQARLAAVHLGRGSTDRVEILSGLSDGDTVVVSDVTSYNGQSILTLH